MHTCCEFSIMVPVPCGGLALFLSCRLISASEDCIASASCTCLKTMDSTAASSVSSLSSSSSTCLMLYALLSACWSSLLVSGGVVMHSWLTSH